MRPSLWKKMALIAPWDHPFGSLAKVEPEHLLNETILHTERDCTYRSLFEQQLNSQGIFSDPNLEFWSIKAIKNCVMSGLGLSFLPLVTVEKEIQEGELKLLAWDAPQRLATQSAYQKRKCLSPALHEFMLLAEEHATRWCQDQKQLD